MKTFLNNEAQTTTSSCFVDNVLPESNFKVVWLLIYNVFGRTKAGWEECSLSAGPLRKHLCSQGWSRKLWPQPRSLLLGWQKPSYVSSHRCSQGLHW